MGRTCRSRKGRAVKAPGWRGGRTIMRPIAPSMPRFIMLRFDEAHDLCRGKMRVR